MNIFSLSFGKDSMATLILAAEQGIPIDRVLYVDIKFNDEISGEHPIMAEWIPTAEKRLKELFGITVEHLYYGKTFLDMYYQPLTKGKFVGGIKGFPMTIGAWCNHLKVDTVRRVWSEIKGTGEEVVEFVGIAYDEKERYERLKNNETPKHKKRSLLFENKFTENDAKTICEKRGLLSPVYHYDNIFRGGCWFCPKQCYADIYSLWKNYPTYFSKLLEIEPDSHITFKPRGVTLALLAQRFENGYIPKRKVKSKFVQLDMFDKI